ncbi:MAG: hypothetical protein JO339_00710 [Alphaproteobacteria bacterium]|nr:hypothetical protein [Alphaproteobacteria bacterium]
MTLGELFTKVGHTLWSDGPAWKQNFAVELGIRSDSVDALAKADASIPPGVWLNIIDLIQNREQALSALRSEVLSLAKIQQVVIDKIDLLWMKAPPGDRAFFDKLKGEFDRLAAERLEGAKVLFEFDHYIVLLPPSLHDSERERLKENFEQLVRTVRMRAA